MSKVFTSSEKFFIEAGVIDDPKKLAKIKAPRGHLDGRYEETYLKQLQEFVEQNPSYHIATHCYCDDGDEYEYENEDDEEGERVSVVDIYCNEMTVRDAYGYYLCDGNNDHDLRCEEKGSVG